MVRIRELVTIIVLSTILSAVAWLAFAWLVTGDPFSDNVVRTVLGV